MKTHFIFLQSFSLSETEVRIYQDFLLSDKVIAFILCLVTALLLITFISFITKLLSFSGKIIVSLFSTLKKKKLIILGLTVILFMSREYYPLLVWEHYQRFQAPVRLDFKSLSSSTFVVDGKSYTEKELIEIYQKALREKTDGYEYREIVKLFEQLADTMHTSTLPFYEACYLECRLDPFRVRDDKVAAGLIQFTTVGLENLRYKKSPVTLHQVIKGCERRDLTMITALTKQYLLRKWNRHGPFKNTLDIYLSIFAPAYVKAGKNKVIYQGKEKKSYYLNKGLDGWYTDGVLILRNESKKDYKITKNEINLCLLAMRARVVKYYHNKKISYKWESFF